MTAQQEGARGAVTARRRLLTAALATITVDYADRAGIPDDEDHPRKHNDLRDLALAARDFTRVIDALPASVQPLGWQS